MLRTWLKSLTVAAAIAGCGLQIGWTRDLRITIPKRSELTPVQRLNREGVEAIRKRRYDKAEALFYKAYLYDPADPFTLNNLGYISELKGNLARAQKFYGLAKEQDSDAAIALSNIKRLEGKPMTAALTGLKGTPMRVNRMNVEAIGLLSEDRNFEADDLLERALALEPANPFTLNNLGVAEEATGDLGGALRHYREAANAHSTEPIVIALKRSWRGRPVSEMAADSARKLRKRMRNVGSADAQATLLTFRGVAATNRNDWSAAKRDFLQAYSLNPQDAFSINNLGYVAEKNGDLETAQFYYSKARRADDARARVGLATRRSAEGKPLIAVATQSGTAVGDEIEEYRQRMRRQTGPIELIPRGSAAEPNHSQPTSASPATQPASAAPHSH